MRNIFGLVLLIGIALAGTAAYLIQDRMKQYATALTVVNDELEKIGPTVQVHVATRRLQYGEKIKRTDFTLVNWPQNVVPSGTFVGEDSLYPANDERDRYVLRRMEKGEAIMKMKVTELGEKSGLTSRLEKGMRAFAIRVDVASGVSGFLRPGDHVDIYWSGQIERPDTDETIGITQLIFTGVKIIAIDQIATEDVNDATIVRTITVAIAPPKVAALAQAQSTGKLSMSLVGIGDDTVAQQIEVDQNKLLGISIEKTNANTACSIKTRRGADVVIIPVPCPD